MRIILISAAVRLSSSWSSRSCCFLSLFLLFASPFSRVLRCHLTANLLGGVLARVGDYDGNFTRFHFLGAFENHFEEHRVNVVSAGQENVFLRTALPFTINELMAILEVVVAGH